MTVEEAMAAMGDARVVYQAACDQYDTACRLAVESDAVDAWLGRANAKMYRDSCEEAFRRVAVEAAGPLYDEVLRLTSSAHHERPDTRPAVA